MNSMKKQSNAMTDLLPIALSNRNKKSDQMTAERLHMSGLADSYFVDLQTMSIKDSPNIRRIQGGLSLKEVDE